MFLVILSAVLGMESRFGTAVVATAVVVEREGESGLAKEDRQYQNHRPVFSQGAEVQTVIGIAFLMPVPLEVDCRAPQLSAWNVLTQRTASVCPS